MATDFNNLPQAIKDLLLSEKLVDDVEGIAKHHGLRPEEYGLLLRATTQLLEGNMPATEYMASLVGELDLSREKAALVAQDINQNIFNPVKEELKQVHAVNGAKDGVTPPQPLPKVASSSHLSSNPVATATPAPLPKLSEIAAAYTGKTEKPMPPQSPPLSAPSQSIFEQKMGGTFRMKSDTTSHAGSVPPQGAANFTTGVLPNFSTRGLDEISGRSEVRPPKAEVGPQSAPTSSSAVMPNPGTSSKVDPYREATG